MKKLNRKVFITIFSILSIFLLITIVFYNIQTYKREFENVSRSLNFIDDFKRAPINKITSDITRPDVKEIDNMMIMDNEVYTVLIKNNKVDKIIGHSNSSSDFDIESIANNIVNNKNDIYIGNLYFSNYAYNYKTSDTLVIVNTTIISNRLKIVLIESIIILVVLETIIYFITRLITKWITKPAHDALDKQKDFIADASHELKTPLAVIMASSDELKSDKANKKYVDNIKYEAERMNKLITGLLDLSKLENKVSINNYKEEDISNIVKRVSLTFESIAYEHNIKINTNIIENVFLMCSKEEIEKLISIILDNAIKHSYEKTTIKVSLEKDKNNIIINVTNSGDSIMEGDEEKIFERFYRGDKSRNRSSNRYGLGLAIAKNIVLNHQGTIRAYSKNKKTTFEIIFKK